MHIFLHKIEVLIDKIIPPLLAALLILIIGQLFFFRQFEFYGKYSDWFDWFVILVFAVDLGFKYERIRKMPAFLEKYWLEIIATLPFFLLFRIVEFFEPLLLLYTAQGTATAKFFQLSRTAKMVGTFKVLSRFPNLARALPFFEKPTGKHHEHEKNIKK